MQTDKLEVPMVKLRWINSKESTRIRAVFGEDKITVEPGQEFECDMKQARGYLSYDKNFVVSGSPEETRRVDLNVETAEKRLEDTKKRIENQLENAKKDPTKAKHMKEIKKWAEGEVENAENELEFAIEFKDNFLKDSKKETKKEREARKAAEAEKPEKEDEKPEKEDIPEEKEDEKAAPEGTLADQAQ